MSTENSMISQTKCWLERLVIAHNLCPFAHREFAQNSIRYCIDNSHDDHQVYDRFCEEIEWLLAHPGTSTTLVIWPDLENFDAFLNRVGLTEQILLTHNWARDFQLAHFHPHYRFQDSNADDPANYTNRSPWPMLHILRSEQMEKALSRYPEPETIPENNIALTRNLGTEKLQSLLMSCMEEKQ